MFSSARWNALLFPLFSFLSRMIAEECIHFLQLFAGSAVVYSFECGKPNNACSACNWMHLRNRNIEISCGYTSGRSVFGHDLRCSLDGNERSRRQQRRYRYTVYTQSWMKDTFSFFFCDQRKVSGRFVLFLTPRTIVVFDCHREYLESVFSLYIHRGAARNIGNVAGFDTFCFILSYFFWSSYWLSRPFF